MKFPFMIKYFLYTLFLTVAISPEIFGQDDLLKGKEIYSSNFIIDGVTRNFTYYMPRHFGEKEQYPLLIFLHGTGSSSKQIIKNYGDQLHAKADEYDCIILYPDAVAGKWNAFADKDSAARNHINDAGFFSILIEYFINQYHADAKHVYVAGINNGGEMAYRLACNSPYKIAAIVPFAITTEAAVKCNNTSAVIAMNTQKFGLHNNFVFSDSAINEMWNFLMDGK